MDNKQKNNRIFTALLVVSVLFLGILYSVQHFVRSSVLSDLGQQYIPVTLFEYDNVNVTFPRVRQVAEGHAFVGEIDIYEYKDSFSPWPPLVPLLISPFVAVADNLFDVVVMTDIVFPLLMFLSLFALLNMFIKNKIFALVVAFVLFLFPELPLSLPPSSPSELFNIFERLWPLPLNADFGPLAYLRRESFIPVGFLFVLSLLFMYKTTEIKEVAKRYKWVLIVLAGLVYGAQFYAYFFFWVFATIFLGLLFLVAFVQKRKTDAAHLFAVGVIGVLVALPFWQSQFVFQQLPHYWEIVERNAIEVGHGFRWFLWKTYLLQIFLAVLVWWLGNKVKYKNEARFLSILSLTGIVALNVQVITGFALQMDHWPNRVFLITQGVVIASILYFVWLWLRELVYRYVPRFVVFGVVVLLVFSAASNALVGSIVQAGRYASSYTVDEDLYAAYTWLDKNTPQDSVVWSPSFLTNVEIPAYTHNRIFIPRGLTSIAPESEMLQRLYMSFNLFGVSSDILQELISKKDTVYHLFASRYNNKALTAHYIYEDEKMFVLPSEYKNTIMQEYKSYVAPEINPYVAHYIFVGPRERELMSDNSLFDDYNLIYQSDDVSIYEL